MSKSKSEKIFLNLNKCDTEEDDYRAIVEACQVALGQEGIKNVVDISLSLVSPEEAQELNRTYRQVDAVTNVPSFPINESLDDHLGLGDVAISLDRIASQAQEYGHSFKHELQYLTVHSVLHCLGYDYIDPEDKKIMQARRKEITACLDGDEVDHEEG